MFLSMLMTQHYCYYDSIGYFTSRGTKSLDIYDVRALIYVTLLRIETNLVEKASLSVTLSSLLLYREEKPTRFVESS